MALVVAATAARCQHLLGAPMKSRGVWSSDYWKLLKMMPDEVKNCSIAGGAVMTPDDIKIVM